MDEGDLETIASKAKKRDLAIMSVEDLKEYIGALEAEIERSEQAIKTKLGARKGAESFFKK